MPMKLRDGLSRLRNCLILRRSDRGTVREILFIAMVARHIYPVYGQRTVLVGVGIRKETTGKEERARIMQVGKKHNMPSLKKYWCACDQIKKRRADLP